MAENDWKSRLGVVFSTNQDFSYEKEDDSDNLEKIDPAKQRLIVSIDRKRRAGKQVTLIAGFSGDEKDISALAKLLKQKCGVGGSAKDDEIIIQGDFRDRIVEILIQLGYNKTKKGN